MRHFLTLLCVLCITACASRPGTRPITPTNQAFFVKGTYLPGSNLTEPRPRGSQFFQTDHAGFVIMGKGAGYYLHAHVLKRPPATYYIRVEYENPEDKAHPLVNDMDFKPEMDGVRFSSPDVVWGIRNYQSYTIRVKVFVNRESTQPIDTLVQTVRAYVDTSTGAVRIFDRIPER